MGHRCWLGVVLTVLAWGGRGERSVLRLVEAPMREYRQRTEYTLSAHELRELDLENAAGNVRVVGGEGDRIEVVAVRSVRSEREEAAQAFMKQMEFHQHGEAHRWTIAARWPQPERREVESPHVEFQIRVPHGFRLEVSTASGSLDVSTVQAARLRTGGGNVSCRDIEGPLDVDTASGSIEVSDAQEARLRTGGGNIHARNLQGRLDAPTASGSIRVEKAAGPVTAHTGGGNVTVTEAQNSVQATSGSGSIAVALAHGPEALDIELRTQSGNVELRLPEMVSARVKADSISGVFDLQLPPGARVRRDRTHMEAILDSGAGSVRLYTGSGAIRVRTDPAH